MANENIQNPSKYDSSTTAALAVELDFGASVPTTVEVWVNSSVPTTFTISGSRNGTDWRDTASIVLAAPGEDSRAFDNAYRYVRVETTDVGNHEAEIVGAR